MFSKMAMQHKRQAPGRDIHMHFSLAPARSHTITAESHVSGLVIIEKNRYRRQLFRAAAWVANDDLRISPDKKRLLMTHHHQSPRIQHGLGFALFWVSVIGDGDEMTSSIDVSYQFSDVVLSIFRM